MRFQTSREMTLIPIEIALRRRGSIIPYFVPSGLAVIMTCSGFSERFKSEGQYEAF